MPPLRGLVGAILDEAANNAASVSIVGAVTLVWGASRFAIALQDAFARMVGQQRERGLVGRNILAFGVVFAMVAAFVLGAVLFGLGSFLDAAESIRALRAVSGAVRVTVGAVPPAATLLAVVLVYRVVPSPPPSWRAIAPPAIVVTVALSVLSQLFVYFAPRFIGAAAVLGTLATVFAALAWLGLAFQAILLGAAWVSERDRPGLRVRGAQPS